MGHISNICVPHFAHPKFITYAINLRNEKFISLSEIT